jgi:hypothetical protein
MKCVIKKYKQNSLKNISEAANLTRNVEQEILLFDQVNIRFCAQFKIFILKINISYRASL